MAVEELDQGGKDLGQLYRLGTTGGVLSVLSQGAGRGWADYNYCPGFTETLFQRPHPAWGWGWLLENPEPLEFLRMGRHGDLAFSMERLCFYYLHYDSDFLSGGRADLCKPSHHFQVAHDQLWQRQTLRV